MKGPRVLVPHRGEGECERCAGSGCDVTMCEQCGDEFTDPCARHRSFGHVPAGGGYSDGVDCSSCCTACHVAAELTAVGLWSAHDVVLHRGAWRVVESIAGASGGRLHLRFTDGTEVVADRAAEREVKPPAPAPAVPARVGSPIVPLRPPAGGWA